MIDIAHETMVYIAKTYGLFHMMTIFLAAVLYACWPGNRQKFDHAKESILHDEDGPCR